MIKPCLRLEQILNENFIVEQHKEKKINGDTYEGVSVVTN